MPSTNETNAAAMLYANWLTLMTGMPRIDNISLIACVINCVLTHESSHTVSTVEIVSFERCKRHAIRTMGLQKSAEKLLDVPLLNMCLICIELFLSCFAALFSMCLSSVLDNLWTGFLGLEPPDYFGWILKNKL